MGEQPQRRLLVVTAHPDDETFGCGGLLAKSSAEGVEVTLICATRGEVGEINDSNLATPENLAEVREQELRAACEVLGVKWIHLLGYWDSGMAGVDDNYHPSSLSQADWTEVVGKIVQIVRQVRPQVIVTFDPKGGYGHPDHISMHKAAKEAYFTSSDPLKYSEQLAGGLQPHQANRLYYFAFPRSMAKLFRQAMKDAGIHSALSDVDAEGLGVPDEEITTFLDVSNYSEKKRDAIMCHRTQLVGGDPFSWWPDALRNGLLSKEHLVRLDPPLKPDDAKENDISYGINSS